MVAYLVIPLIPGLRDYRLERREFFVGHGERSEDVLLEKRRTRKGEQQCRRERLAAVVVAGPRRKCRVGLAGNRLLPQVVLQCTKRSALSCKAVLYVLEALHAQFVAHVEPKLTQLLLFHERAVFALSLPRGGPHALAS